MPSLFENYSMSRSLFCSESRHRPPDRFCDFDVSSPAGGATCTLSSLILLVVCTVNSRRRFG